VHEWALAEGVVTAALAEAERNELARVERIEVRVGQLQQISEEAFRYAIRKVIPAAVEALKEVEVRVTVEPARFRCRACARRFALDEADSALEAVGREAIHFIPELAHAFLRCPECRSPDFEMLAGRGVRLVEIRGS
jgi:hydrogenase nickel incorporation protein HypA/HybF